MFYPLARLQMKSFQKATHRLPSPAPHTWLSLHRWKQCSNTAQSPPCGRRWKPVSGNDKEMTSKWQDASTGQARSGGTGNKRLAHPTCWVQDAVKRLLIHSQFPSSFLVTIQVLPWSPVPMVLPTNSQTLKPLCCLQVAKPSNIQNEMLSFTFIKEKGLFDNDCSTGNTLAI